MTGRGRYGSHPILQRMSAGDRVSRILGSTAVQGAIAALPAALSTTGDPQLVLAGLGISVVNASLIAHISGRGEDNRDRLAAETESRLDRLEEQQQFDEQVL